MNFTIKAAAAAVALALAGAAHAEINTGGDGSPDGSTLGFFAYSSTAAGGPGVSTFVDLGFNIDSFASFAQGLTGTAVWNFATNTFQVNGASAALGTGETAGWSTAWTTLKNNPSVAASSVNFGVFGVNQDTFGAGFTNTQPTEVSALSNAVGNGVNVFASFLPTAANAAGVAGAFTSTSGLTYAGTGAGGYGNGTLSALPYFTTSTPGSLAAVNFGYTPAAVGGVNTFTTLGTFAFNYANNTLTFTAAAIPEPGTYALMLAGLAAAGLIVRRRASRA